MTNNANIERDDLNDLSEMFQIQVSDVEYWWAEVRKSKSIFARRALARSIFSFIEGVCFRLKKSALAAHSNRKIFDNAELSILREESYEVDQKGSAIVKQKMVPTLNNLKFSVLCFAKAHYASYRPDFGDSGWESLQKAILIRHKLTHPKENADLDVHDDEIQKLWEAYLWFNKSITLTLTSAVRGILEMTKGQLNHEKLVKEISDILTSKSSKKELG